MGVGQQRRLIGLELLPADVARMRVGQKDLPLHLRDASKPHLAGDDHLALARAAVHERARVAGIVEDAKHAAMVERGEDDLAGASPPRQSARPQSPLASKVTDDFERGAHPAERVEEEAHRTLDLRVGIECQTPGPVDDQTDRRPHPELTPAGLVEGPAQQAGPQDVPLRLTHGALEAEEQPVVEVTRIVNAVLIEDERLGQRADFEKPVPVAGIPRQPGHLQAHHEADPAQPDLGDQPLEATALRGRGAGQPEILIDHHDLLRRPAERLGAALEVVLARGALAMILHRLERGLPHVEIREPPEMLGRDLARARHHHRPSVSRVHASTMPARTVVSAARLEGKTVGLPSGRSSVSPHDCLGVGVSAVSAASQPGMPRVRNSASPWPRSLSGPSSVAARRNASYCSST
jgi:hypothetical protein